MNDNDNEQTAVSASNHRMARRRIEKQALAGSEALLKRRKRRHLRTLFLAIVAAITFVWASIYVWDVEPDVMFNFFTMSLLLVALLMLMAAILVGGRRLLKRLFDRYS